MATSSSNSSTAIVALVALAVVGLLVWFFVASGSAPVPDAGGIDVDVTVPGGD